MSEAQQTQQAERTAIEASLRLSRTVIDTGSEYASFSRYAMKTALEELDRQKAIADTLAASLDAMLQCCGVDDINRPTGVQIVACRCAAAALAKYKGEQTDGE